MFFKRSLATVLVFCAVAGPVLLMRTGSGVAQVPGAALLDNAAETDTAAALPETLLSGELSAEERRELLARLSDSQVRELLLRHLDQTAEDIAAGADDTPGFIDDFEDTAARLRESQREVLGAAGDLPTVLPFVLDRLSEGKDRSHLLLIVVAFAVLLLVGFAAEWLVRWLTRDYRRQVEQAAARTMAISTS
jgi:hypothetical protein